MSATPLISVSAASRPPFVLGKPAQAQYTVQVGTPSYQIPVQRIFLPFDIFACQDFFVCRKRFDEPSPSDDCPKNTSGETRLSFGYGVAFRQSSTPDCCSILSTSSSFSRHYLAHVPLVTFSSHQFQRKPALNAHLDDEELQSGLTLVEEDQLLSELCVLVFRDQSGP